VDGTRIGVQSQVGRGKLALVEVARPQFLVATMKVTDDYKAKLRLWAARPTVVELPPAPQLPRFSPQRFTTHTEMNRWKQALLRELARTLAPHG